MPTRRLYASAVALLWVLLCGSPAFAGGRAVLRITNPRAIDRGDEVIEIPIDQVLAHTGISSAQLDHMVVRDAVTHATMTSQLYASHDGSSPDTLLLLVHLNARASEDLAFTVETQIPHFQARVFGREAPERKDDFAWENQLVTYRVYGPALQATGEITSGIDVWSKRVPNFVIDSFYKRDALGARTHNPALSYHKDNGQGLDSYYVGPTRGCGGTAVFSHGRLYVSKNYTTNRIVANGPIRFAFELSYAPWNADGVQVQETKRVILDVGTHLNRITSTYVFAGGGTLDVAAGIAVHAGAQASSPVPDEIASVWDTPQDSTAGRIATGLVALPDQHAHTEIAAGHALMLFRRKSGMPFTYFAGAGWSKADMPSAAAWTQYLQQELARQVSPIEYRWHPLSSHKVN